VGSTTALIKAAKELPNKEFIVATDNRIFYKMKQEAPGKTFIEAPTAGEGATCKSCAHCPWMAMNGLHNLDAVLESGIKSGENEIFVDENIRQKAYRSTSRMLEFVAH
jgi:quinolinate synthase